MQTSDLAKARVKARVIEGGHNIENGVIERRYHRGIKNLFNIYLSLVDEALIFDNSEGQYELIAEKIAGSSSLNIINQIKFLSLKG